MLRQLVGRVASRQKSLGPIDASATGEVEARLIAPRLVLLNLGGHDSHCMIRAPTDMQWLREGKIKPGAAPCGAEAARRPCA
jgi:LDH2 family malate/lactate/ureidoglycolate dehydrogenase